MKIFDFVAKGTLEWSKKFEKLDFLYRDLF